ncbi:zf-TFIIB domain-containing protein [Planctomycetes bacterium K23_9]|uniref:Uncharacterized protein n=1 Tax=Stieleria marina TaxID=1930275 RepID=A0A517NPY5_9BACT|nr:hypothetical protein K239x_11310 [Planctomycetes bacterium K23_9]
MHTHDQESPSNLDNFLASVASLKQASPAPRFDEGGQSLNRGVGVLCPKCQCELQIGELAGCQFAGCPSCQSMLFQQDVFAMLIQHLRASKKDSGIMPEPMDASQLQVRRICPTCTSLFETHAYGGPGNAVIDTCTTCAVVFLDQGELTKLANAPGRR